MRPTTKAELLAIVAVLNSIVRNYEGDHSKGMSVTLERVAQDHKHTAQTLSDLIAAEDAADQADEIAGGFEVLSQTEREGNVHQTVKYKATGRIDHRTWTREQLEAMNEDARRKVLGE